MTDDADYEYEQVPVGGHTVIDRHGRYFNSAAFKESVERAIAAALLGERKSKVSSLNQLAKLARLAIEEQTGGQYAETVHEILVKNPAAIADLLEFERLRKRTGGD